MDHGTADDIILLQMTVTKWIKRLGHIRKPFGSLDILASLNYQFQLA